MEPESSIVEFIQEKARAAQAEDWHTLLDVAPGAAKADVRRNYLALLRALHPGRITDPAALSMGPIVARITEAAAKAHAQLAVSSDAGDAPIGRSKGYRRAEMARESARRNPDAVRFSQAGPSQETSEAKPTPGNTVGEGIFRNGVAAFHNSDFPTAEKHFRRARELNPEEVRYLMHLSWTILRNPDRGQADRVAEAQPLFEEAAARAPWSSEVRYRYAQFWRETGDLRRYRQELEATVRCDGSNKARALLELKRLEERGGADESEQAPSGGPFGFLSRILSRASR